MQDSTRKKIGRVAAYVAGGLLNFFGIMGLAVESSKAKPSFTNFYGYVLAVTLFTCGILTLIAIRSHYGGGLWSFLGLLFVAETIGHLTWVSEVYLRGRHLISPVTFYSETAIFWAAGCYCLVWGHMRHHRKKATQPNTALEPTPTAP
jgi:hypothetical protein